MIRLPSARSPRRRRPRSRQTDRLRPHPGHDDLDRLGAPAGVRGRAARAGSVAAACAPLTLQRQAFLEQAVHCDGRSPLYAGLCRRLANDPRAGALAGSWKRDVPLRLLGGLHYLVLEGKASWEHVDVALEEHAAFLRRFIAGQAVQTNEVQRSWVLLPLFLYALGSAESVDVVELGTSAGLNLFWDRYRYRYEGGEWGPADASLTLAGEERRRLPSELLEARPRVRFRLGIDQSPVDVTTDEGARLLRAFVWAGQEERVARLDRAIEALRSDPPRLLRGDVAEMLPGVLAGLPPEGVTLVFQTGLFGYLSDDTRARLRRTLDGTDRDLVFVTAGRPRGVPRAWGMRIRRPGRRRIFAGHADYHGAWLDYEL